MKTNKHFHFLLVFIFLVQTMVPPALLAQTASPGAGKKAAPRSVDDLFDDSVTLRERQLLFEFVQYVNSSIAPREGLRKAAEELQDTLQNDRFWFSVDIKDPDMAALLEEANSGRRYLLEKTFPVENRIHDEQRKLEKQLIADHEKINATGLVPDGFMELVRSLAFLYDRQDDLWEMKIALLFKISTLTNNIDTNYLSLHPKTYAGIRSQIDRSKKEMKDMAVFAAHHQQQLLAFKARYKEVREAFNAALAKDLINDRKSAFDLNTAVRRQAVSLEKLGDVNARHHAELLDDISRVLEDRIDRIDDQVGQLGVSDKFPNPLFVPPGLGTTDQSRSLADDYREIAKKFITQTRLKAAGLRDLKKTMADIKRLMGQEHIYFQSLVSEADSIPDPEKHKIPAKSAEIVTGFTSNLGIMIENVDKMITLADSLDFDHPDRIIGSKGESAKAFRLNRELADFLLSAGETEQNSLGVDIRLYALLSGLDFDRAEKRNTFKMLRETSLARSKAVEDFSRKLSGLQAMSDEDAALAGQLKQLGQKIISQGKTFYESKTKVISKFLNDHASAAGQPYYDYLTGVGQQLEGRLDVIQKMLAASRMIHAPPVGTKNCPDCPEPVRVWPELAGLGTAYTDTLRQFDNLADIESYFTQEKLTAGNILAETRLLFDINARLGNEPFLHLNPDSIDVVFTAGLQMVVVKGIGDPGAMDFAVSALGPDYLTQAPYIGGWLSSTISSIGDNWIKPIGRKIANTASNVVSSAVSIGGKIATKTGQVMRTAYNGAKSAVKTVGKYGSKALKVSKDFLVNVGKTAFLNDDGSISLLKVGSYALGGAACALTGGLACIGLAVAAGVNVAQGGVNTAKDYGYISKLWADRINLGLDVVGIVAGGYLNYKSFISAGAKAVNTWQKLSGAQKLLIYMGMNPKDLKGLQTLWKADWGKVKNWTKMGSKLVDSFGAWRNIPDWYDKVAGWCGIEGLPSSGIMPGDVYNGISGFINTITGGDVIGTGTSLIRDLMLPGVFLPGLKPYPYSIGYDPFSSSGTGIPGLPGGFGSGSGVSLPGSGQAGSAVWTSGQTPAGGTGPGVILGPDTQAGAGTGAGGTATPGDTGAQSTNGSGAGAASGSGSGGVDAGAAAGPGGPGGPGGGGLSTTNGQIPGGAGAGVSLIPGDQIPDDSNTGTAAGTGAPDDQQTTDGTGAAGTASIPGGTQTTGQHWTVPGQTSTTSGQSQSPHGEWENPYGDWVNPYGNWVNPYGNWVNPYR
jgi:hypothetical protein